MGPAGAWASRAGELERAPRPLEARAAPGPRRGTRATAAAPQLQPHPAPRAHGRGGHERLEGAEGKLL